MEVEHTYSPSTHDADTGRSSEFLGQAELPSKTLSKEQNPQQTSGPYQMCEFAWLDYVPQA